MIKRFEFKYIISEPTAIILASYLHPFVTRDTHCKDRPRLEYPVHSIYFDTVDRIEFQDKIDGVPKRAKIRLRFYNTKAGHYSYFLERKSRNGDITFKERERVSWKQCLSILERTPLVTPSSQFVQKIHEYAVKKPLFPVVRTLYFREAYYGKYEKQLRLNFDRKLAVSKDIWSENPGFFTSPKQVIFEIKSEFALPQWLMHTITASNLRRSSFSKYCTALAQTDLLREHVLNTFV